VTTTTVVLVAHICITEYYVNELSCLKVAAVSDSFAVFDILQLYLISVQLYLISVQLYLISVQLKSYCCTVYSIAALYCKHI